MDGTLATSGPGWTEIASALNSLVAALAVVIGGWFAYVRYARGRVLHGRCHLDVVDASPVVVAGAPAMRVTATVTNAGSLRLLFPADAPQILTITVADRALWEDACRNGEVLWTEGISCRVDLLTKEGTKEGG